MTNSRFRFPSQKLIFVFLILSSSLIFSLARADEIIDYPTTRSKYRKWNENIEKYWKKVGEPGSQFTNPDNHGHQNFTYVVHVIDGMLGGYGSTHKWAKVMSEDPTLIRNKPRISSSVVADRTVVDRKGKTHEIEHRSFFKGKVAFILDVPHVNFGPMDSKDLATTQVKGKKGEGYDHNAIASYFQRQLKKNNKMFTPLSLAIETRKNRNTWNEVLVMGTNKSKRDATGGHSQVKVSGVIFKCEEKQWKHILNTMSDYNFTNPIMFGSLKINFLKRPELVLACLMDTPDLLHYAGFGFDDLKDVLDDKDNQKKLSKDEMRLLYAVNIYEYMKDQSLNLPIILYYF
jgi:hypothetical protein